MSTGSINIPIKALLEVGRDFYHLSELAEILGCTESLLLQHATRGNLQLSILTSPTMYVEEWGGYLDDGETEIPQGDHPAGNRILPVLAAEVYKFLTGGATEVVSSRTEDSYYKIVATGKAVKSKFITHNDLVVTVADADKFIGIFNQKSLESLPNSDSPKEIISAASAHPEPVKLEKPLSTRERNKLLDLIHGMARYTYKANDNNVADVAKKISGDIWPVVSSVSEDAVEACLMQAMEADGSSTPAVNEKELFLKIIIGIAVAHYMYKPGTSKNIATGSEQNSIHFRLQGIGVQIDSDTIRRYLKMATQYYLP